MRNKNQQINQQPQKTRVINQLEGLRAENIRRIDEARWNWIILANSRFFETSKILIASDSILAPLLVFPFQSERVSILLNETDRLLLGLTVILLLSSVCFGFVNSWVESNFFLKWAKAENERMRILSNTLLFTSSDSEASRLYMSKDDEAKKVTQNLSTESSKAAFFWQIATTCLSLIFIAIVVVRIINKG